MPKPQRTAKDLADEQAAKLAKIEKQGSEGEAPGDTDGKEKPVKAPDKPPEKTVKKPEKPEPKPKEGDEGGAAEIGKLKADIEQLKTNYGEVRAQNTRVEQDNSLLRSEIDLMRSLKKPDEDSETPPATTTEGTTAPETKLATDALDEMSADFPEIVVPLRRALDQRTVPIFEQLKEIATQVGTLTQNVTLTKEQQDRQDQERGEREHFKAIQKAHSDWHLIVNSESFREWLRGLPGGTRIFSLMYPQSPQDPGLSADEVIEYITDFKERSPEYKAEIAEQEEAASRVAAAGSDSEGDAVITGGATITGSEADVIPEVRMSEVRRVQKEGTSAEKVAVFEKAQLASTVGKLIDD